MGPPFDELNAEVSPNDHWLAYESNESGRPEIYVRPFPNVDADRPQVSTNGGTQPLWARNGQELFYESMGTLMRVPLKTGATFERGTPEKVFDASPYLVRPRGGQPGRMYDVSADGKRFLMELRPRRGQPPRNRECRPQAETKEAVHEIAEPDALRGGSASGEHAPGAVLQMQQMSHSPDSQHAEHEPERHGAPYFTLSGAQNPTVSSFRGL
jgi:hypothetical protein